MTNTNKTVTKTLGLRCMKVVSDGRGTWAGREVQTDDMPVVGVPETIHIGDDIIAEYRAGERFSGWHFVGRAQEVA